MTTTYAQFATSEGNFTVRLFDEQAPRTVENFVGLAEGTREWSDPRTNQKVRKPYYDGTIFHRVIDGFMIQGGDPLGQGIGGPGYNFADEFHPKLRHNKAGILSMANRGPNTNGGQFFIILFGDIYFSFKAIYLFCLCANGNAYACKHYERNGFQDPHTSIILA